MTYSEDHITTFEDIDDGVLFLVSLDIIISEYGKEVIEKLLIQKDKFGMTPLDGLLQEGFIVSYWKTIFRTLCDWGILF